MVTFTKQLQIRVDPEFMKKISREARREKRSKAAFIRRVLERYIEDKEFTKSVTPQKKTNINVQIAAKESMTKNQELLKKLEDT
jgi:predicted DNA-binding protein